MILAVVVELDPAAREKWIGSDAPFGAGCFNRVNTLPAIMKPGGRRDGESKENVPMGPSRKPMASNWPGGQG